MQRGWESRLLRAVWVTPGTSGTGLAGFPIRRDEALGPGVKAGESGRGSQDGEPRPSSFSMMGYRSVCPLF